jgi:hypothetical protein
LPDFSWYNTGKIYQITIKYTKWPQNWPNCRKIDQMGIKYQQLPLQEHPKFIKIWIFGLKICHLATLSFSQGVDFFP